MTRRERTAREILDREMLEDRGRSSLASWLTDLCRTADALAYHTHNSRRSSAGYPDWTIITRDGRIAFVELKTEAGKLSPAQERWRAKIEHAAERSAGRVAYFLVTPSTRGPVERWLL